MSDIDSMGYWMQEMANRSENTKKLYRQLFGKFVEWVGKGPDELIEMQQKAGSQKGDRRENRIVEGKVKGFLAWLVKEGYAINTQRAAYNSILSFFECNQYPLDMGPQDRPSGEGEGSRIPEKEEILRMLNHARSRQYRAAILFLKDSGLRISDAVRLRWDDMEDMGEGFWGFKVLTKKRKVQATPFVGPETTKALKALDRKDPRIFPITVKALSKAVSRIASYAGLEDVTAHGLRKFFNVELQAARIPREWRYQMMGKKTGAYNENRARKLFEAYREAYDNLRVYGASVNAEVEKLRGSIDELRQENQLLRSRLNNYEQREKRLEEALERMGKIEKQLHAITKHEDDS